MQEAKIQMSVEAGLFSLLGIVIACIAFVYVGVKLKFIEIVG